MASWDLLEISSPANWPGKYLNANRTALHLSKREAGFRFDGRPYRLEMASKLKTSRGHGGSSYPDISCLKNLIHFFVAVPGLDHLQALWGKSMYEFWGDLITDAIAKDSALWGRLLLRKMPHPHAFFLLLLLEQVYVSVRGWGRNIQACLPANQIRILYLPCSKIAHLTLEDVKAGKIKFLVNCASQAPGFGLGRWETCILWYPDINCWLGIEI